MVAIVSKWIDSNITKLRELAESGYSKHELADYFGVTVESIRCQCCSHKISLSNPRWRYWTPEEEFFLDENAGILPCSEIAKKLKRSPKAVWAKATRMGLSLRPSLDNFSALELSQVTKISITTLYKWIKSGRLQAQKTKSGHSHKIKVKDFIQFALDNPNNPAIKRIDLEILKWFEV